EFAQAQSDGYVSALYPPPGTVSYDGDVFDVVAADNTGSGVVGESISLGTLRDVLAQTGVGRTNFVYTTDKTGKAIDYPSASEEPSLFGPKTRNLPQVHSAIRLSTDIGAHTGRNVRGEKVLAAWATIPVTGWKVFVEQPESAAFTPLRSKIWKTALIITAFVLAAVALSILLARRLVRPIKLIQVAADAIGAGAYDERIELNRKDELGALAAAF